MLTQILRLTLPLLFVVAESHANDPDHAGQPSRTLKEVINRAREIPAVSLHQWLRDERILASTFTGGISFDDAVKTAKAAKLPLLDGWQNGSAILRRYKLRNSVFKFANGKTADAYLFFRAFNKEEAGFPFVATNVDSVEIGLLVHVGLTYQQTIDQKIFADGTALRRSLELDEVKEAGASWPWLDCIFIHYGKDYDRWQEFNPSGFYFETTFVASRKKDLGDNQIDGFIASGLDPVRNWKGEPAPGDFIPEDTLDDPKYQGGSYTELPEELKLKPKPAPNGITVEKK